MTGFPFADDAAHVAETRACPAVRRPRRDPPRDRSDHPQDRP